MKNLFSIGEVSKIKDITIKTLRYYHKVGILVPRYIDEETGYRYYSIDQFIHIDIIKGCRSLGNSIAEIQEIFKDSNTDTLLDFLKIKKNEAEENINKMNEIIKNIDMINESVYYAKEILNNDDITSKHFKERYIVVAPCMEVEDFKELLYYSELDKVIQHKNIEISIDRGILYEIKSDYSMEPKYVFNGLEGENSIEEDNNIKVLKEGIYLTLTFSKENEQERIEKMLTYIKENNINAKNIIIIDLINDFFNTESYSCQIQVLI